MGRLSTVCPHVDRLSLFRFNIVIHKSTSPTTTTIILLIYN